MKAYTDLEQSKKLAEILPLESADFVWLIGHLHTDGPRYEVIRAKGEVSEPENYWPCWSLAALLDILPKGYSLGRRTNGKYYVCMTHIKHNISEFDNPIDACYEMILKLHELKFL